MGVKIRKMSLGHNDIFAPIILQKGVVSQKGEVLFESLSAGVHKERLPNMSHARSPFGDAGHLSGATAMTFVIFGIIDRALDSLTSGGSVRTKQATNLLDYESKAQEMNSMSPCKIVYL